MVTKQRFSLAQPLKKQLRFCRRNRDIKVVAIDFATPGLGGLKGVERLVHTHPNLSVILMDQAPSMAIGGQALRAGVAAYVPLHLSPETLADALKIASSKHDLIVLPRINAAARNKASVLSRRELQILSLLCDGQQNKRNRPRFWNSRSHSEDAYALGDPQAWGSQPYSCCDDRTRSRPRLSLSP